MTRSSGTGDRGAGPVPARRGAGLLLWVALTFLATLSVVGVFQHIFARQVTTGVERSIAGDLACSLSTSVLEEAMHRARLQVNDPTSPLFFELRKPVAPRDPGVIELTRHLKLIAAPRLLEGEPFASFSFTAPQAEVLYRHPCDRDSYEHFGLVHYWTRAAGAIGSSETVVRELHAYQELKTALVTTPRPFDQMPLYVGRASAMTDQVEANRLRQTVLGLNGQARDALQRAVAATPTGPSRTALEALLAKTVPPDRAASSAPALPVDPDAHVTALWLSGQSFVLDVVDLARKLQQTVPTVEAAVRREQKSSERVVASPRDEESQRRLREDAAAALTLVGRELLRIWSYTRAFRFISTSTPEYARFESVAASRLSYEHFRRTAFFVLRETPPGQPRESLQSQWERLRRRASTPSGQAGSLSGIVLIENLSERIELRGDLHGKLIVVTLEGGLSLADVNPGAGPDDSLVAVSLGGTVELSGAIHAAVVAAPYRDAGRERLPRIVAAPSTVIRGGLYVATGLAGSEWHGRLTYDDRYFAGPVSSSQPGWPSHYHVGLGPLPVFQVVTRR